LPAEHVAPLGCLIDDLVDLVGIAGLNRRFQRIAGQTGLFDRSDMGLRTLHAANRASGFMGVSIPPQQFLTMPLAGMVLFATFLTLGVINRRKPASHKRLMLLASISLVGAPIARITAMIPQLPIWLDAAVFTAFTIAMSYWDVQTRGKVRPETLYGGPAIVLVTLAAVPIGSTAAWQNVAFWMMSFAGPP
jgi:hypothetical protein